MQFALFARYAEYLLHNYLSQLTDETISLAKEMKVPMIKVLEKLPPKEFYKVVKERIEVFLIQVSQGQGLEGINDSYQKWQSDQYSFLPSRSLVLTDIILVNNLRKQVLIKFLDLYTNELNKALAIVMEIEAFYSEVYQVAFKSFMEVQEQKVVQEHNLTQTVLNATLHAIVALKSIRDESGKILDFEYSLMNSQAEKMLGKSSEYLIGKRLLSEYPSVVKEGIFDKYKRTAEGIENYDLQFYYPFDGLHNWFRQSFTKWNDGLVIVTMDISQDKQKEKELNETYHQLNKAHTALIDVGEELKRSHWELEEKVNIRTAELKAINHLNSVISVEKDINKVIRAIVDTSIQLSNAEFGAFSYSNIYYKNQPPILDSDSDPSKDIFYYFPNIKNSAFINQSIEEKKTIRVADISNAYKINQSSSGQAALQSHAEIRSFMALPVLSNHKEVLGTIFLGHSKPDVFTDKIEGIVAGVASQASIAIDSIKLFESQKVSEALFRSVTNATPAVLWMSDKEGRATFINQTWIDWTGKPLEYHLGKGFYSFIVEEDQGRFVQNFIKSIHDQRNYYDEFRIVRKDGKIRWLVASGVPRYQDNGEFAGLVGSCIDITERKLAEKQLQENEFILKIIANRIPAFVSYIDPNERYLFHNDNYYKLPGVNESFIRKSMDQVLPEYYYKKAEPYVKLAIAGMETKYNNKLLLKDGTEIELEINCIPDKDNQGKTRGVVIIGIDLTERLQFERKMENQNKELRQINTDLDAFIYTASHDLKAPVSNIEGLIYSIKDIVNNDQPDKEQLHTMFEYIDHSIQRFKNTILDLTEISRIQKISGNLMEKVNLQEIIDDVMLSIADLIRSSGAQIKISLGDCLFISFTKSHLKSIVYNLISNAIKYRSPNRPIILEINCQSTPLYYLLQFKDNGLGIAKSNLKKIFEMFRRVHDHVEGSGVGLYIVKRIVENNGGKVEVESEVDKGSNFRIYIKKQDSE